MAGVGGFEPPHDGVKVRCLSAWLYPNIEGSLGYDEQEWLRLWISHIYLLLSSQDTYIKDFSRRLLFKSN